MKLLGMGVAAPGGQRYTSGSTPTTFHYTGQREQSEIGLYFYNARWYDASLGRFAQADTIIPNPGDPASYDRFSYVRNNPLRYIDPSGYVTKPPTTQQCGPDNIYCGGLGDTVIPVQAPPPPVTLTEGGQALVRFAYDHRYSPDHVIQMGLYGEISSWYLDDSKVERYVEAMGVRYQWYRTNFCGGADSWVCRINFWTAYSQTVNTIIYSENWENIQGDYDPLYGNVVSARWGVAGRILNATINPLPEWTDFNSNPPPDSLPNNQDLAFDVGIMYFDFVMNTLGRMPVIGVEGDILYFEECAYNNQRALCVIMTVRQWKLWYP